MWPICEFVGSLVRFPPLIGGGGEGTPARESIVLPAGLGMSAVLRLELLVLKIASQICWTEQSNCNYHSNIKMTLNCRLWIKHVLFGLYFNVSFLVPSELHKWRYCFSLFSPSLWSKCVSSSNCSLNEWVNQSINDLYLYWSSIIKNITLLQLYNSSKNQMSAL